MAEIEETEHGDEGRVREWMGRAMRASGDPVWTADGVVSDRWLPVTPNGRLDGFEWKLPLAEIGVSRPVIEVAPPPPKPLEVIAAAPPRPKPEQSATPAPEPVAAEPAAAPSARPAAKAKPVEPVIPLVHAPDDPGPDSGLDGDPVPEPSQPSDAWQRIKELFRLSKRHACLPTTPAADISPPSAGVAQR